MTKRKPTSPAPRRPGVVEVHHHYHGVTQAPAEPKAAPAVRKPPVAKPTRWG